MWTVAGQPCPCPRQRLYDDPLMTSARKLPLASRRDRPGCGRILRANTIGQMRRSMAQKANPATRHVISINDLSDKDIETIFEIAQSFLTELPDPHFPYRIGRSTKIASDFILASLFFEPSHAHAAVVRKRHAASRRRGHHQRRSGHQLGRQRREPRRFRAGHLQLCRHHGDPPSARRRGPAGGGLFADPGHQRRRRQPRASDPDAVRPVHADARRTSG